MPETLSKQKWDSLHLPQSPKAAERFVLSTQTPAWKLEQDRKGRELVQPTFASASTRLKHFRHGESRILTLGVPEATLNRLVASDTKAGECTAMSIFLSVNVFASPTLSLATLNVADQEKFRVSSNLKPWFASTPTSGEAHGNKRSAFHLGKNTSASTDMLLNDAARRTPHDTF